MSEKRRAARGYTHDAYDCCGAEPESSYGRPKNRICDDCAALIAEGKASRAAKAAMTDAEVRSWPERAYAWPRFYENGGARGLCTETHDRLAQAFWELVNVVTTEAPGDTPHESPVTEPHKRWDGVMEERNLPWPHMLSTKGQSYDSWSFLKLRLVDPAVAAALDALHIAATLALNEAFQTGKERGGSVLLGLASGETSLSDFEQAMLPPEQRKRR